MEKVAQSLGELAEAFLLSRRVSGCTEHTLRIYHLWLGRFIHEVGEPDPLAAHRFVATWQDRNLKPATIHRGVRALRAFFRWYIATGSLHDDPLRGLTIRLPKTLPQVPTEALYEIASNRGGRHDPDEVDPNEMDAIAAMTNCFWILAEMIRVSNRGAVSLEKAKEIVDSLVEKKYPLVERVDGRVYFHGGKKSALDVLLLALADVYPRRLSEQELVSIAVRHRFKLNNANLAVTRIRKYVDDDGHGQLRLLAPGLERAEQIKQKLGRGRSTKRRSRRRH